MDQNVQQPVPPPIQQNDMSTKPKFQLNTTTLAAVGLLVVILILAGGTLFYEKIKTAVTPVDEATKEIVSETLPPSIDPNAECLVTAISEAIARADTECIVDLSNQNLSSLPADTIKLQKMTRIILKNNNFTTVPEVLAQIPSLVWIDLSNNQITSVPEELAGLKQLQILDLTGNNVPQADQDRIRGMFTNEIAVAVMF